MELFKDLFKQNPLVLIDVGASGGIESPWNLKEANLEVVGFEPDAVAFNELEKKKTQKIGIKKSHFKTALYNKKDEINFHVTRRQGHSSIFEPNNEIITRFSFPERYDVLETRKISAHPLDDALRNAGILDVDFIKLDTQGSELAILEGGSSSLPKCFGIDAEVEFLPLYKNQPLFSELEIFLRDFGFELFDIKRHYEERAKYKDLYQMKGQLVCGDALFLKSYNKFIQDISTEGAEKVKAKIMKGILICYLYKLIDYAFEITEEAFNRQYLTEKEKEIIIKQLRLDTHHISRYIKGMNFLRFLAGEFFKLMKKAKPHASYDDETLGNIKR